MRIWLALVFATSIAAAQPVALEPTPVGMDMTFEAATKALDKARMKPRPGELRRYIEQEPGKPIVHTSEPEIYFVPKAGWTGLVHFNWSDAAKDDRITRVELRAELSARAIAAELATLERRYGKSKLENGARAWNRGGTSLRAFASPADPKTKLAWLYVSYHR